MRVNPISLVTLTLLQDQIMKKETKCGAVLPVDFNKLHVYAFKKNDTALCLMCTKTPVTVIW